MGEISILDILYTFRYRWKLFLSIVLGTILLGVAFLLLAKPKYEVKAVVKANVYNPYIRGLKFTNLMDQRLIPMTPVDKIGSEIELIKSRAILGKVIFDMGLNLDVKLPKGYHVTYKKTLVDTLQTSLSYDLSIEGSSIKISHSGQEVCGGSLGDTIDCKLFLLAIEGEGNGGEGSIFYKKPSDAYEEWKGLISIDQEGLTDLISIIVTHDSLQLSREIANRLAESYVSYEVQLSKRLMSNIKDQLLALLDSTEREIAKLNKKLRQLKMDTIPILSFALDAMTDKAVAEALKWYFKNPSDPKLRSLSKAFTQKQFDYYETYEKYRTIVKDYTQIIQALHEADLHEAGFVPSAYIVTHASIPSNPIWPRKKLILLVSLVLGIILAMLAVLLYDWVDRSIRSPLQLKRLLKEDFPIFYDAEKLRTYVSINGWEKIYCIGKGPDDLKTASFPR